jgi:hypothetical protein
MSVWIRHRIQHLGIAVVVMSSVCLVGCNIPILESAHSKDRPVVSTDRVVDAGNLHQDASRSTNPKEPTVTYPKTSGEDVWATKYLNQTYQYNTPYTKGQKVPLFESLTKKMAMGMVSSDQVKKTLYALKPWKDTVAGITQDWEVGFAYTWTKQYITMPTTVVGMNNLISKDIPARNDEADYFYLYVYYNAQIHRYTISMLQVGMKQPKVFKIINHNK